MRRNRADHPEHPPSACSLASAVEPRSRRDAPAGRDRLARCTAVRSRQPPGNRGAPGASRRRTPSCADTGTSAKRRCGLAASSSERSERGEKSMDMGIESTARAWISVPAARPKVQRRCAPSRHRLPVRAVAKIEHRRGNTPGAVQAAAMQPLDAAVTTRPPDADRCAVQHPAGGAARSASASITPRIIQSSTSAATTTATTSAAKPHRRHARDEDEPMGHQRDCRDRERRSDASGRGGTGDLIAAQSAEREQPVCTASHTAPRQSGAQARATAPADSHDAIASATT